MTNRSIIPFEDHDDAISAVAVFPDRRRMVTGSYDKTLNLWDLKSGIVLKKMEGHCNRVHAVAVGGCGQLIASGDKSGQLIVWDGETGEYLAQPKAHWPPDGSINSLDFSPDGAALATGSSDGTTVLWNTETWRQLGDLIHCDSEVHCIRYSPSGKHLAIATAGDIQIWNPITKERLVRKNNSTLSSALAFNNSLAWTPNGTRLLSGSWDDPIIHQWDSSTWKHAGHWNGDTNDLRAIAVNPAGTLVASASYDYHVRLWRLSDLQMISIFNYYSCVKCLTFSSDGKEILSGGEDRKISKWAVPLPYANDFVVNTTNAALLNAQKIIDLNPSSYHGYRLKHAALHDAECYDEAIAAFETMLSKLDNASDVQTIKVRQNYLSQSEADAAIRMVIDAQLDNAPLRLLDTTSGLLCDREAQIRVFKTTTNYKELLSLTMKSPYFRMHGTAEVVAMSFRCVMLSHRWGEKEPLLHDIQKRTVYQLDALGGTVKLQSFCKIARSAGYRWAWSDTCCIDKNNNVELQQSLNSMFLWYRYSALTIVYLSDVPPSSESGALAKSEWNMRGWTVGEFLASKSVRFYQSDWTPYLDDHSPNHKESVMIMQELGNATGIDRRALVTFSPGVSRAREKLQWASTRVTTLQEDIAYSLFGIFGINLPIIYGEKKHNALGRLLQEIIAQSGDITALDWVGKSSTFNSCLPADITSYKAPPSMSLDLPPEDEMQKSIFFLRDAVGVELASEFYTQLDKLSPPRFAHHRLHLPCLAFHVTAVRWRRDLGQETSFTYAVKADGLHDLLITTEDKPNQFSRAMDTQQTLLLVRPWSRYFLELPDSADDMQSVANWSAVGSSVYKSPSGSRSRSSRFIPRLGQPFGSFLDALRGVPAENGPYSESYLQALRLIVRLGQHFSAFLLAQQPGGEYKRIASDRQIIAQVKDINSVRSMMDVRTLEIL